MALTVDIYKSGIKLASGSATGGSASIGSVTPTANIKTGRNVQVQVTQAGTHVGRTWNTKVLNDGGATVTIREACPFIE